MVLCTKQPDVYLSSWGLAGFGVLHAPHNEVSFEIKTARDVFRSTYHAGRGNDKVCAKSSKAEPLPTKVFQYSD